MKKFKCKVTRVEEYEIEFDDSMLGENFINEFKEVFFDFNELKDHAAHIAEQRAKFGEHFMEGYGLPKVNGQFPYIAMFREEAMRDVNFNININVISEDAECEVEVEEIN